MLWILGVVIGRVVLEFPLKHGVCMVGSFLKLFPWPYSYEDYWLFLGLRAWLGCWNLTFDPCQSGVIGNNCCEKCKVIFSHLDCHVVFICPANSLSSRTISLRWMICSLLSQRTDFYILVFQHCISRVLTVYSFVACEVLYA